MGAKAAVCESEQGAGQGVTPGAGARTYHRRMRGEQHSRNSKGPREQEGPEASHGKRAQGATPGPKGHLPKPAMTASVSDRLRGRGTGRPRGSQA